MTTAQIPTHEPTEITPGETVKWRKSLPDFSAADGWVLKYYFRGPGQGLDIAGTDYIISDGAGWLITIPATAIGDPLPPATDQLITGAYYWDSWVEKEAEKYRVEGGKVTVKPSLAATATTTLYDGRSEVKQMLDAIRAAIAGRATAAQQERTIGNTTIRFMTIPDLMVAETKFQQLYNQERRNARLEKGEPLFRTVHTRFVPPR